MKRLLFVVLLALAGAAQATVYSLPWGPKPQFVDANGAPMSGGFLLTYAAGSVTPQVTYTDSTGGTGNPTTITLNVRGETPNEVWLTGGSTYKFLLKDSAGATVWTVDNVSGVNDTTSSQSEWVTGPAPTYVSGTSFTLVGDQTTTFHIGRRLRTTNSGGTIYSTITNTAFGALTTVTVENDASTLDAGLSAVSYGLISQSNESDPAFTDQAPVVVNKTDRTKRQRLSIANVTTATTRVLTMQDANLSLGNIAMPAKGRCTLTTALPVTTADVTGATTVYYTPYQGDLIQLYDGNDWNTHKFTELSQTTADATKSPAAVGVSSVYDVFVWIDSGTLRATRGPLWDSDTSRGTGAGKTELEFFEGRWVNKVAITNGPAARRGHYVCSIRSDASSQINDSLAKRHVWNNYNRVIRALKNATETADSWTYSLAAYRQANANAANQLDYLYGLSEDIIEATVVAMADPSTSGTFRAARVGIGVDSTTVNTATVTNIIYASSAFIANGMSIYRGYPGIGRHFLAWLELATAGDTTTWYGDQGTSGQEQSGITGVGRF